MRARARLLFLRTVFQILLRISQSNGKNENPKTDISALKSVFGFRVRLEIRNPDFENLNQDFPIERTFNTEKNYVMQRRGRNSSDSRDAMYGPLRYFVPLNKYIKGKRQSI